MTLLPLAKMEGAAEQGDEYLVSVTGIRGKYEGRIFRCRRIYGQTLKFVTALAGKPFTLFEVDIRNIARVFVPGTNESYEVYGGPRDNSGETKNRFIESYREGKKWAGTR